MRDCGNNLNLVEKLRKYFLILFTAGGDRSAAKFLKSQIRKFADLQKLLDQWTPRKCGYLRICDLWAQFFAACGFAICGVSFLADLKLPQIRN